ncbi:hypothetical protein [Hoeflea sp. 108]|uniref:hypothetical protein n=1 Tax=Hoeflea sp. 108 TaxID=1116369 RepID=UPI0003A3AEA7|nr:hypothetical protein [Hoeflea sp. 108]
MLITVDGPVNYVSNLVKSPDDLHDQFFVDRIVVDVNWVRRTAGIPRYVTTPNK